MTENKHTGKRNLMLLLATFALFTLLSVIKAVLTNTLDWGYVVIFGLHIIFLKLIIDVNGTKDQFFVNLEEIGDKFRSDRKKLVEKYKVPKPLRWFYG